MSKISISVSIAIVSIVISVSMAVVSMVTMVNSMRKRVSFSLKLCKNSGNSESYTKLKWQLN